MFLKCNSFEETVNLERRLHDEFADKCVRGEWFKLTEDDLERIRRIELVDTPAPTATRPREDREPDVCLEIKPRSYWVCLVGQKSIYLGDAAHLTKKEAVAKALRYRSALEEKREQLRALAADADCDDIDAIREKISHILDS